MASAPNVLALFGEPDRKSSLIAIANAVRLTKYRERLTSAELAERLRCDPETIENAEYERNLIGFDKVARLLALFPDHCQDIRNLWEMQPVEAKSDDDELADIEGRIHAFRARKQRGQA
jgi:hypothetical protein